MALLKALRRACVTMFSMYLSSVFATSITETGENRPATVDSCLMVGGFTLIWGILNMRHLNAEHSLILSLTIKPLNVSSTVSSPIPGSRLLSSKTISIISRAQPLDVMKTFRSVEMCHFTELSFRRLCRSSLPDKFMPVPVESGFMMR